MPSVIRKRRKADRKKKSKAVTKKVIQMSSKLSVPLAAALHKAADVLSKAEAAGFGNEDDVSSFKEKMKKIEMYKNPNRIGLELLQQEPRLRAQGVGL